MDRIHPAWKVIAYVIALFITVFLFPFAEPYIPLKFGFKDSLYLGLILLETFITAALIIKEYLYKWEIEELLAAKGYTPEEIRMFRKMDTISWLKRYNPKGLEELKKRRREFEEKPEKPSKPGKEQERREVVPAAITAKGLTVGFKSMIVCPNCSTSIVPIRLKTGDLLCPVCGINLVEGKGAKYESNSA